MDRQVTVLTFVVVLGASIYVLRPLPSFGQTAATYLPRLTAAQLARIGQAGRLTDAAARELDIGQYTDAEDDARKSIALMPANSGVPEELLAQALNAEGKTEEALRE